MKALTQAKTIFMGAAFALATYQAPAMAWTPQTPGERQQDALDRADYYRDQADYWKSQPVGPNSADNQSRYLEADSASTRASYDAKCYAFFAHNPSMCY